jgi:hypothetical protein
MIAQIIISESLIPFIVLAFGVVLAIIGYFLKKAVDNSDAAKEKADRAFQETIIIDNKIDSRQKAIDEKLERTLSSLNETIKELSESVKPIALVIWRLEQLEEHLNKN